MGDRADPEPSRPERAWIAAGPAGGTGQVGLATRLMGWDD